MFVQGVYDLWKLLLLSGAFVLGMGAIRCGALYFGITAGYTVSIAVGLFQLTGWDLVERPFSDPAGLFFNPNIFGEIGALLTVALFASGFEWLSLVPLMGVMLSHSRTAVLALAVCGAVYIIQRKAYHILILLAMVAIPLMFMKPLANVQSRLAIWSNTIDGLTLFGRGPGSFIITYPTFASRTDTMTSREEDAHNDFLQMAYQYGIGAALLIPMVLVGLFGPLGPERYLFIAFCIIACFNFPLQIPLEGFLGAFAMGRCWRDRHLVRWYGVVCRRLVPRWLGQPQSHDDPDGRRAIPVQPFHSD